MPLVATRTKALYEANLALSNVTLYYHSIKRKHSAFESNCFNQVFFFHVCQWHIWVERNPHIISLKIITCVNHHRQLNTTERFTFSQLSCLFESVWNCWAHRSCATFIFIYAIIIFASTTFSMKFLISPARSHKNWHNIPFFKLNNLIKWNNPNHMANAHLSSLKVGNASTQKLVTFA